MVPWELILKPPQFGAVYKLLQLQRMKYVGGTPAMRIQPLLFTFSLLVLSDQLVFELAGDALQLGEVLQRVAGAASAGNNIRSSSTSTAAITAHTACSSSSQQLQKSL